MVNFLSSCFSAAIDDARHHSESTPLLGDKISESMNEKLTISIKEDTTMRLRELRAEMVKEGVDLYVVPTADQHGSEMVGESDSRRSWISGFSGSAGVALITNDKALLLTDSRYFIQAAAELDQNWTLVKVLSQDDTWEAHVSKLPSGSTVGMDPRFVDYKTIAPLIAQLASLCIKINFSRDNLIDRIWQDQPAPPSAPIVTRSLKFSGKSAIDKITDLRSFIANASTDDHATYLVTSLNNISWILNLRGGDIQYNPVFAAYLLVGKCSLKLFVDKKKVSDEVRSVIEEDLGGSIMEYDDIWSSFGGYKIVCDSNISWAVVESVGQKRLVIVKSPIDLAEAIKNPVEIEGFKRAYLRDGVAFVKWQAWLEEKMKSGANISEWDAAEKLTQYRSTGENFAGLAYDNISATNQNAALPHYAPTATQSRIIDRTSPYLNDSGAQYFDGTIDTTRTVHFGKPTPEQRLAFTRVLQGHIAIDSVIFPTGTTGFQLDVFARAPLWRDGLNYGHGTGHGIGSYLSVHEGPHGIGPSIAFNSTPLQPGMCTSNEPAYYEAGQFGIRIETVLFVKEVETERQFGDSKWLGFERFTTVPIQSSFVDLKLLSKVERQWLKDHNSNVAKKLLPFLKGDKRARKYLSRQ